MTDRRRRRLSRRLRGPVRLLVVLLFLTAPFYMSNLMQGMDPVESARMLPAAYERGYHWAAGSIQDRLAGVGPPGGEQGRPPPPTAAPGDEATPALSPDTAASDDRPPPPGGDGHIAGVDDGRAHIGLMEELVLEMTNHYREMAGVDVLAWDPALSDIAREHSEDMSENDYLAHRNLQGRSPSDRAAAAGYVCRKEFDGYYTEGVGENLFQGWLFSSYVERGSERTYDYMTAREIAQTAVDGLMDSPGHRENILEPSFDRLGVGVAVSGDQKVYVTQKFC